MPDWILLLPLSLPWLGALALPPLGSRLDARARRALTVGFVVATIALLLLNIAPGSHRLTIAVWSEAALTFALQMDGVTQIVVLTLLVSLLAHWLAAPPRLDADALLVLAAALLLAAADGMAMTLAAWTLLDLALFGWRCARAIERAPAFRSLAIGLLTSLLFFAGALSAPTDTGASLRALALWARLGLFPFQHLLPAHAADESAVWFARGIPTLAAANVWLHWSAFNVAAPFTLIGILTGAHIVLATLWMWRAENATTRIGIGAAYALAFVPLTLAFGGDAGIALALWQTLASACALTLGEIAQRWRAKNQNAYSRWLWLLALLALAGLPLTPAFIGRLGLYVVLTEGGEWLFLTLVVATTLGVFAPLWSWLRAHAAEDARVPARGEFAGSIIALSVFTALALAPMVLAPALGITASAEHALERVIRPNNALSVLIGASVLLLPLLGAFFLGGRAENRPGARAFAARAARVSDLAWLEHAAIRLGTHIGTWTRDAFTLTEENPTVWILFAALWVAIFIAITR